MLRLCCATVAQHNRNRFNAIKRLSTLFNSGGIQAARLAGKWPVQVIGFRHPSACFGKFWAMTLTPPRIGDLAA
jgi:hypothetical protein